MKVRAVFVAPLVALVLAAAAYQFGFRPAYRVHEPTYAEDYGGDFDAEFMARCVLAWEQDPRVCRCTLWSIQDTVRAVEVRRPDGRLDLTRQIPPAMEKCGGRRQ